MKLEPQLVMSELTPLKKEFGLIELGISHHNLTHWHSYQA